MKVQDRYKNQELKLKAEYISNVIENEDTTDEIDDKGNHISRERKNTVKTDTLRHKNTKLASHAPSQITQACENQVPPPARTQSPQSQSIAVSHIHHHRAACDLE